MISRHIYSEVQTDDLIQTLKKEGLLKEGDYPFMIKFRQKWSASESEKNDTRENKEIWKALIEENDVIAGVFPPVALQTKPEGVPVFISIGGGMKGKVEHKRWMIWRG